ncbi:thiamine pyrophosphate-binding protein [Effusibacillus dendaii]|uniref:Pyruvate oxidase n=1 Tax=Effusibacillus dendaii TaxID=2743772 RepID=A0A7I8DJ84_9BACL|nr:thiamine pyrophosphate-binding protein [Effusibacillus dendaii]BCJ87901.1 pyruvate oxidase [Effusibacillus dendaii]
MDINSTDPTLQNSGAGVESAQPTSNKLKTPWNNRTVAELILDQLKLWGVKRIYGVVGDAILGLLDAIAKQDEIRFIAVKHESAAAMMASAEAKLTGALAVCAATMGPGLGNLLNGLGDAYLDKAPVLVITGQAPTDKIGTEYKQYINQQELIRPLAAYSTQLVSPFAVVEVLVKAMQTSLTQGAVSHLSIPKDMFTMLIPSKLRPKATVIKGAAAFQKEDLQQALQIMESAKQPMILAGIGAKQAASQLEKLARQWGAGILLSLGAKGILPESSDYLLGGIGQGGNPYAADVFKQADVVLLVGDTWWPEGYVPTDARIIQIDNDPVNIAKGIPVEVGIVAQSQTVVPLLAESLSSYKENDDWISRWKSVKQRWQKENEQEGKQSGSPIHPARVVRAVEMAVQPDAIIALDTGNHTVWINRNFRAQKQEFLFSGEWRTMGFGLPAAIAAKLVYPERQVVCIVGDGGIEMVLAELLTTVRYKLPIIVIVLNNHSLQMERDKMQAGGFQDTGSTELTNPDFVKLAEACGWQGIRVDRDNQLDTALQQALSRNKPTLVDITTSAVMHPETKA